MKYVFKSKKNYFLVEFGGYINKQELFLLLRKFEILIDKIKNIILVKCIIIVESFLIKRKIELKLSKEYDKNKGILKVKLC